MNNLTVNMRISWLLILTIVPFRLYASLWDNESKCLEDASYQTVLQALVGNYLKHSQNYHFWRISMYEAEWNKNPDSLILYDAIAVSYFHTRNTKEAIRFMIRKERQQSGLYSTYANFMSFYIAEEELYKARFYGHKLKKNYAILAPRERMQIYLIDYLLAKRRKKKIAFPIQGEITTATLAQKRKLSEIDNFYQFLVKRYKRSLSKQEINEALFGVLQLLRFSTEDDLILLEIAGDMLLAKGAGELAAFAYLRNAQLVRKYKPDVAKQYEFLATEALLNHSKTNAKISIQDVLVEMTVQIRAKENYLQSIFTKEKTWLNEGLALDSLFEQNYCHQEVADSLLFVPRDTLAPHFIWLTNQRFPDYLIADANQKELYLATLTKEDSLTNENGPIIVSRIDRFTSLKVVITAISTCVLALFLFFRFRRQQNP